MDVIELLDELELELGDRKGGLFTKKIDLERCFSLVREIRKQMPTVIRESQYVLENKQRILENADTVAKNTIREAEEHANHIVSGSEISRRAEADAQKLIENTYAQCDALVDKTKTHLDGTFREIEQFLQSTLTMIRTNREELRGAALARPARK